MNATDFVDAHLNVWWLRPESALFDAIASGVIAQHEMRRPSLDFGSGNGIFSFITAGGLFSPDYDWHRNVDPKGFWENRDIYDTFLIPQTSDWILKKPDRQFDYALDHKHSLLQQAKRLDFYLNTVRGDGNRSLPFGDESFQTVFSNILYWLNSAENSMREVWRVLRPAGRFLLCLQDHRFKEYCVSYQWRQRNSELLRLLNRGRSESNVWTLSYPDLMDLSKKSGFKVISHEYYLSPLTLKVWDIGLRPLSAALIKMVQKLTEADRREIKREWIDTLRPFILELCHLDQESKEQGGFHFVCLEKSVQ
jgi:SAM-dependent methyltransferase